MADYLLRTFPDGSTFDADGNILIVSVVSNRIIQVDKHGKQSIIIKDADMEAAE